MNILFIVRLLNIYLWTNFMNFKKFKYMLKIKYMKYYMIKINHLTVTVFAKFLGLSGLMPFKTQIWLAIF